MITDQDKCDIFVDFLNSAEWALPIHSFIDYYCVIFATPAKEHVEEKTKVFNEYKSIVGSNLHSFVTSVLKIDVSQLGAVLSLYHGSYSCLEYVLAVEDYDIFHNFMFETNKDLDRQVTLRQSEEDALIGLLDKPSSVTKKVFKKKLTEE